MGSEEIFNNFLKLKELFLEENKIIDKTLYSGNGMLGSLWKILEILIQSRRCHLVQKLITRSEEEYEITSQDLTELESLFKLFEGIVIAENADMVEKKTKVKKIQAMIKKKISKWLLLVNTFVKSKKNSKLFVKKK